MRETGKSQLGPVANFLLAGTTGAVGRAFAHPFSVLKIQSQSGMPGGRMGTVMGAYWILRLDGVRGFFKALPVSVVRIFPQVGIQYAIFHEYAKTVKPIEKPNLNRSVKTFVAGGIAHNIATLLTHPLDVVKTRTIVCPACGDLGKSSQNWMGTLSKILSQEGIRGIYRGLVPSLIGSFIFSGTMFTAWDFMDCLPWRRRQARPFLYGEAYILSVVAVSAAAIVSQPVDVIRHKVMASSPALPNTGYTDVKTVSVFEAIARTYRINGFRGFFHGSVANVCKSVPQVTVFWIMYNKLPSLMESKRLSLGNVPLSLAKN
ncbi:Mito carr domain containing protein [Trichuris trichiura]|uniref:Mito carr domain containing protein n=1 Tax=Trichuris trichiura TaxID=36087 RepID=A0A077YZ30_TRITR|nr:Mito carr domain containing protein [Trichuris trichiura]